jgi:hypothetical protein
MHRQLLAVAFDAPDDAGRALREALAALANGHGPLVDARVAARGAGGAVRAVPVAGIQARGVLDAGWWHGLVQRLAAGTRAEGLPAALARDVAAALATPGRSTLLVALPPGDADGGRLAAALGRHGRVLRGELEDDAPAMPRERVERATPVDEVDAGAHRAAFGSFP